MAERDFKDFCSNSGILGASWKVLMDNGVTNEGLLRDLRDDDFDTDPELKQLHLGQRRRLQKMARGLRDAPNQTQPSDNSHGPPPVTSVLKREAADQTQPSDNSHGPPPVTSVLKREAADRTQQSDNSQGPPVTSFLKRQAADEEEDPDELRIVLIGKTGSGKSSVGNTILNLTEETGGFDPACGQAAATTTCKRKSKKINGRNIRIIDTPGLYDPDRSEEDVAQEISRCLLLCLPGPHALLFVCKGHDRFTDEESRAYRVLKAMFGIEVRKYTIVVFTGGDVLDKWGKTIEDEIKGAKTKVQNVRRPKRPPKITEVLEDVSDRYILFNNKGDAATKDQQVFDLLKMVTEMVNNNGDKPYFQEAKILAICEAREKELKRITTKEGINRTEALQVLLKRLEQQKVWKWLAVIGGTALTAGAAVVAAPLLPEAAVVGAVATAYCSIM